MVNKKWMGNMPCVVRVCVCVWACVCVCGRVCVWACVCVSVCTCRWTLVPCYCNYPVIVSHFQFGLYCCLCIVTALLTGGDDGNWHLITHLLYNTL